MGKQSGALCAHILCQILQLSGKSVVKTELASEKQENEAAFAAARMVLDAADSTTQVLVFYCPSNNHRVVQRVQGILSPQITVLTAEDDEARTTLLQRMKDARGCLLRSGAVTPLALDCVQRTYGVNADCDVHAQNLHLLRDGTRFLISDRRLGQATNCYMPLIGRESVEAACGAAAAAQLFGLSAETVRTGAVTGSAPAGTYGCSAKKRRDMDRRTRRDESCGIDPCAGDVPRDGSVSPYCILANGNRTKAGDCMRIDLHRRSKKVPTRCFFANWARDAYTTRCLTRACRTTPCLRIETAERADEKLETIVAAGDVVMQCLCK